jgi:hypothetical protein
MMPGGEQSQIRRYIFEQAPIRNAVAALRPAHKN